MDRVLLDTALAPALAWAGLASVDAVLALAREPDATSVVREVERPVPGTNGRFHLKAYRYAGWSAARGLVGRGTLFGSAPSIREFKNLVFLREKQIPAVRPIAAVQRTRRGRLVAHAILTEHVAGAPDLAHRLRDADDPLRLSPAVRRRALTRIGRHLGAMHAEGFVHADAWARNVLVRVDEDVRIFFLDCRRGGTSTWRRGPYDDLATIDLDLEGIVPATDRLRALKAYLASDEPARPALQRIARRKRKHVKDRH